MRADLVAVGTELVVGDQVDTNSAWIASRLAEIGVGVRRHTAVGDDVAEVAAVLAASLGAVDVVVVTGGLGPTPDDLTREAVAAAAGVRQSRRADLEAALRARFEAMGRPMPVTNLRQVELPDGAVAFAAVGTAPGFSLDVGATVVCCVPGVPSEMREMVDRDVVGLLVARGGLATTVSHVVRTAGMAEAAVGEVMASLIDAVHGRDGIDVGIFAGRGETRVKLSARAVDRAAAEERLAPLVAEAVALLGPAVTGLDDEGVEFSVARALLASGRSIGLAESVTAGGVAARLARVPGASAWLRGAMVVYATDVKGSLAEVPSELLAAHGPVSEPVCAALAGAARERLGADVGLAIVGVAGPSLQDGIAVGTIVIGVDLGDLVPRVRTLQMPPRTRTEVQDFAVTAALDVLRRQLAQG